MEKRLVEKMTSQYFPCTICCSLISCRLSLMSFPVKTFHTARFHSHRQAQIFSLLITSQASVLFSDCFFLHYMTSHYTIATQVNEHRFALDLRLNYRKIFLLVISRKIGPKIVQCIPGLRVLHITYCHFIVVEQFTQKSMYSCYTDPHIVPNY